MRKYNPFRNVFYYYRGPASKKEGQFDKQTEDNTTKALINTLENGEKGLLMRFFKKARIDIKGYDKVAYDLQVEEESSRPDALIQIDKCNIFIESKIDSPLKEDQIYRHLESISKDYLICITPRDEDRNIIQQIKKSNLRFVSWKEVYLCFKEQLEKTKDEKTKFIIQQFLEYIEAINMAPFNGWNKKDFEAFLNIEDDPKRELRLRVKEKLKQYLIELKELLNEEKLFEDLEPDVGNIKKDSTSVWGVICKPPIEKKVHKAHFNFWVNSDEFGMGIQIEGKSPANKMKKSIDFKRDSFLEILKKLEGFDLIIRKRVNPTGRPRGYYGIDVIKIKLGGDISLEDIEYLIKKLGQYKLFEIHCAKSFKRDEEILNNQSFMKKSMEFMKQLQDYYNFSFGGAS